VGRALLRCAGRYGRLLALTDSPVWLAGAAVFLVLLGMLFFGPARYRRRARLLQESVPD
jgi:hypothetical protein